MVSSYNSRIVAPINFGPPHVVFSDNAGVGAAYVTVWTKSTGPDGSSNILSPDAQLNTIYALDPTQVPPVNQMKVWNFVSMAVDQTNPEIVYVAFVGRPNSAQWQTDLYIAKSSDSGVHFVFSDVIHLTDAALADPTGSFQLHPAIAVDKCGNVNVMYYRVTPGNPGTTTDSIASTIDVRYARVSNFGSASQSVFTASLIPAPFSSDQLPLIGGYRGFGDYQTMTASRSILWTCFASPHEAVPGSSPPVYTMNYYVRYIKVPCVLSDSDADGDLTSNDVLTFANSYTTVQPQADVNHDGSVNPNDWVCFINSYACGCNP